VSHPGAGTVTWSPPSARPSSTRAPAPTSTPTRAPALASAPTSAPASAPTPADRPALLSDAALTSMFTSAQIEVLQGDCKNPSSSCLEGLIRRVKKLLQDSPDHDFQEHVAYFDSLGPVSEMDARAKKELVVAALEVVSEMRPLVFAANPPRVPSAAPSPARHAVLPAPRKLPTTNYGAGTNRITVRSDGVLHVQRFTAQMTEEWPDEPEKNRTVGRVDAPVRSVDRVDGNAVVTFGSDDGALYSMSYKTNKSTIYINDVEYDIKEPKSDEVPGTLPRSLGGFY